MSPLPSRPLAILLLALAALGALRNPAMAMPPGRAWAPYSQMQIPGSIDYVGGPLFDRGADGVPRMVVDVRWDSAAVRHWNAFAWRDSAWRLSYSANAPEGFQMEFVIQSGPERRLVWLGYHPLVLYPWLLIANFSPDSIGPPDSIFATTTQSTEYAAAASARRRWAIRSEQRQPELEFHVRVHYSDTARIWHEVERLGIDEDHCTVAPLGDTTAMVVYAGLSGLQYAILDGTRWVETGNLDPRPYNAAHPRFRLRPSGGLWLFWADNDWMHMSSYRNGAWDRGDSLRCLPVPGETFRPTFLSAEMDTTEYPAIGWTNSGYGSTWRDVTAIAFGNGHGWDAGEELPDSELSGWFAPTLTTDLNGDLWIAWRRAREGVNRWTHSYCSATCAAPAVTAQGAGTRITWTLTSRAPGSRWTVFRAAGDGAFDSLGTVRADEDSVLVLDDYTAGPGATWHYRIRRESVDVRYRWESDFATHWRPDTRSPLGLALANPTGDRLAFRLTGATGLLWARLFDLQGRVVLQERLAARGTGDDAFTLDLAGTGARHPGVYFLRITDSTGRRTRTARVAVVL